jgi:predicted HNH restriction endonuclease
MSELAQIISSSQTSFKIMSQANHNEVAVLDEKNQLKLTISSNVSKIWLKINKTGNDKDIFFEFCKLANNFKAKVSFSSLLFWSGEQIIDVNTNELSQIDSLSIESSNVNLDNKSELAKAFFDCLEKYNIVSSLLIDFSELEGAEKKVFVKKYERSQILRRRAIEIHGVICKVCGFNFELNYGEIGKDFIHIHHLEKISNKGEDLVDPIKDLVPICPNCHAMLHSNDPPMTLEELKEALKNEI